MSTSPTDPPTVAPWQRRLGLRVDTTIFGGSAAFILIFVPVAALFKQPVASFFGALTRGIATYFGWYYILSVTLLLLFLLWVAFGRAGKLKLGPDHALPEYRDISWFTMLFAAGIGTVLMFWGVAEPVSHFMRPPMEHVAAGSTDAAKLALDFSLYHFGLHTWAIFATPGLALGFFVYRRQLPLRFSSVFQPLLGRRIHTAPGKVIDVVAVVGTVFGVATSLGLGTLQITRGLDHLFGLADSVGLQTGVIAVVTALATTSVVLGMDKGVRRLSELNIMLAVGLMIFVFAAGPTVFILQGMIEGIGSYLSALPSLAFWNDAYHDDGWQQKYTIFYWAWTTSWAPFVGIFVARISYGRTLKEFVLGVLLAPTLFTIIWFSVFGLAAFDLERQAPGSITALVANDVAVAIYGFLARFPAPTITCALALLIVVIFFTTSADSASLVVDTLTTNDAEMGPVKQRVFWAVAEGVVAAALLYTGGFEALANVITTLAFPFSALMVVMALSLARALRRAVPD